MENESSGAPAPKKLDEFWVRLITGIVYCAVLLAFFALKIFVSDLFFDALLLAITVLGTFEMLRAFGGKITKTQKVIVMIFAALIVATYAVSDFIFSDILDIMLPEPGANPSTTLGRNYSVFITSGVYIAGAAVLLSLLVFRHEETSLESTGYALLSFMYPSCFLVVLVVCNHLEIYSALALLFVFVLCPFSDSFALVFGRWLGKRFPYKMAPHVSPKKTVVGGIGGLFGGALGGAVIFFCYYGLTLIPENLLADSLARGEFTFNLPEALFFVGLGILTAVFCEVGDLVESAIKRKIGIKDMGKLLPGHGGILDRVDSSLYAGLIVCLVMVIRIMIFG